MKPTRVLLVAVLFACGPAFAIDKPVNDRAIESRFVKLVAKRIEEKKAVDPASLQEQLKAAARATRDIPLANPGVESLTPAQIYKKRGKSIVALGNIYKCDKCDEWHSNLAGGVILTPDGVTLTNYHVVEDGRAAAFGAITSDGTVHAITEVLAASKASDLALVKLDGNGFEPAPVAFDEPVGSPVTVISHPDGRYYSLTTGIISRYFTEASKKGGKRHRVAITADFARGSSGCPVFNEHGAVVALVSTTSSIYYNRSKGVEKNLQMVVKACIPTAELRPLLAEEKGAAE